ncbi:MAG: DUF4402 domain-containing protein [Bacteroidales bacterium]|nr:DUF4402 domain-containing protein [Bacteroidales bacterium]
MKVLGKNKWVLNVLFLTIALLVCVSFSYAQPGLPQRTVTVQATQDIDFGTFYATSSGTITVDWMGNVSTTGGVVSLSGSGSHPAIFEIKLCQGRDVTITYDPTTTLTNGAPSLTLNVGDTEKGPSGSTFEVNNDCNFITTLRVGGTLEVPGGSPAGTYTGSFEITFDQE